MHEFDRASYIAKRNAEEKAEVEANLANYGTVYHPQDTANEISYLQGKYGMANRKAFLKKLDGESIPNRGKPKT